MTHWSEIAATPPWLPLLNMVAIAGVQALHAFSAILVLQCFRRRQLRWLFYAMAFHSGFDLLVFGTAEIQKWLATVVSIFGAILSLYILFRLRDTEPERQLELRFGSTTGDLATGAL